MNNKDNKVDPKKRDQSLEEIAINQKEKESDGREINHQVKDKREHHQPRDTA